MTFPVRPGTVTFDKAKEFQYTSHMSYPTEIYHEVIIPPAYPHHVHSSNAARDIAFTGLVLLTQVGSGTHGTAVAGQDDRDEMGICLEPPEYITGLATVPRGNNPGKVKFEQYERHTAWDRPGGVSNRSGAGDLDTIIYSARKWCRLAMDGNPTVLLPLFVPDSEVIFRSTEGANLVANADKFISINVGKRFLGYLGAQKGGMMGLGHTNRPELVEMYGYDTKFAMHAVRLGFQGIEILETGKMTLPINAPNLRTLRSIRNGEWSVEEVMSLLEYLEEKLKDCMRVSNLPPTPDENWINNWLHRSYLNYWERI